MTPSPGVSVGGQEPGGVWCDPPGSRQIWEWVVLGPRAASAPRVLPTWVLPWGGGHGWVGGGLSVPRGSRPGWRSCSTGWLADWEGFGWGMSPTEQYLLGGQCGGLGGEGRWSSLVGVQDHPASAGPALPRAPRHLREERGALDGGTACPSFPPSPAAPRCHDDRARPRPRKCLFLLLHHFPSAAQAPARTAGAGGHVGDRSSGPAPRTRPCCRHSRAGESGWVLSPWGPLPHVTWANHAIPPSSVPLLTPLAGAEAQAGGTGCCTGALCALGACRSPALVLPVLGVGHSSLQPLTLRLPAPELPGTAQWGAGTSHL